MNKKVKNVLYIGHYLESYPRSFTFIQSLRNLKINVFEISFYHNYTTIPIIKYFIKNFKQLENQNFDLIIYHSMKFSVLFLCAKFIAFIKRIPLINDSFISYLLSLYYDRKLEYRKYKKKLKLCYWVYYYLWDFIECHLSNYIILDTIAHIKYFREKFNLSIKKFRKIFLGARDDIFYPIKRKKENKDIIVGFWGSFIPLQGIQYIIKAIKLLENENQLKFILIGNGSTSKKNRELANRLNLKNLEFIDFVPIEKLPKIISIFDIGLGIFGNGLKTKLVIPNKVFEGNAMKIPMITCRSPAIEELFIDNKNILLCEPANPESLANAILKLMNDTELRSKISKNAYIIFKKYCGLDAIEQKLKNIFNSIE